uniref:Expressed conserved protein n=1 Tax=Steinernema glaseri TaxID=37863 RepID=A0A1I7ZQX3_9BILA
MSRPLSLGGRCASQRLPSQDLLVVTVVRALSFLGRCASQQPLTGLSQNPVARCGSSVLSIRRAMLLWTFVFFLVFVSSSTAESCIYPKVLGGVYCNSLVFFSTERALPNLDRTLDELLKANKKSVDCKRPLSRVRQVMKTKNGDMLVILSLSKMNVFIVKEFDIPKVDVGGIEVKRLDDDNVGKLLQLPRNSYLNRDIPFYYSPASSELFLKTEDEQMWSVALNNWALTETEKKPPESFYKSTYFNPLPHDRNTKGVINKKTRSAIDSQTEPSTHYFCQFTGEVRTRDDIDCECRYASVKKTSGVSHFMMLVEEWDVDYGSTGSGSRIGTSWPHLVLLLIVARELLTSVAA